MLLSDKRILEEMECGNIVIDSFDPKCLNTNSYDCRLGEYYFQPNNSMLMVSLDCAEDIKQYWGSPQRTDLGILVHPGTTILAHTQEIVGGKSGIVAHMHCRSTIARLGLSTNKCAGFGDVGYIARWTMEISNHTRTAIYLPVGIRICQFSFEYVGETLREYQGNYGQGIWKPEDMLPKAQT